MVRGGGKVVGVIVTQNIHHQERERERARERESKRERERVRQS